MHLPKLNLPECDLKVRKLGDEQYIWDDFRKKEVVLLPEEWVRQHFLHLMVNQLQYPKSWIRVESGLQYDKRKKRSDIELLNNDGSVFLLVECKAPGIQIDQKALNQISLYNKTLKAQYIALTNGLKHYFWKYDLVHQAYTVLDRAPEYQNK